MELLLAVIVAGPLGFLAPTPRRALLSYLVAWAIVFPIQTISVHNDGHLEWSYFLVNAVILGLGIGLNRFGARRRAQRQPQPT